MVTQTSRIDALERVTSHLQQELTTIQAKLKATADFQKFVLAWMNKQDKQLMDSSSSGSGFTIGHNMPDSPSGSFSPPPPLFAQLEAIVARSEERSGFSSTSPSSIAQSTVDNSTSEADLFDKGKSLLNEGFGSKSSGSALTLDHNFPNLSSGSTSPPPSLLAQLETIVSRSEEHLRNHGQLVPTSYTDSRTSGDDSQLPTPGTPVASGSPKSDAIPVGQGNSIDSSSSSMSSLPNSPSLLAPLKALISRSDKKSSGHGITMRNRANWAISDVNHCKLGLGTVVGQVLGQTNVVDLIYPVLGPQCENNYLASLFPSSSFTSEHDFPTDMKVQLPWEFGDASDSITESKGTTSSSVAVLIPTPFDRGKGSSLHILIGSILTSLSWIVHGQGRPPEDATKTTFLWIWSSLDDSSLEDKTVLKGEFSIIWQLRNCKRIEKLEDPVGLVKEILKLCPAETLIAIYKLPSFNSVDDFLFKVATLRGKLKKGGIVDISAAARIALHDWNEGKILFYTMPPARNDDEVMEANIVSKLGKEFNVDEVYGTDNSITGSLKSVDGFNSATVLVDNLVAFDEKMLEVYVPSTIL